MAKGKAKRQKRAIEDDLICPITRELLFDPVTAEDGRVYERNAIEEFFETKSHSNLVKSPMTSEMIRKRVFPAVQIKNTIEVSIENGYIKGKLAEKWHLKAEEKKEFDEMLKEAEDGDVESMIYVGYAYHDGTDSGCRKDMKLAFNWFDKARIAGSVRGLADVGEMLVHGTGVAQDKTRGLMYLSLAAERGSDWAAAWLGECLAFGYHGLSVNKEDAIQWLKKVVSGDCAFCTTSQENMRQARETLERLQHEEERMSLA